jgi:hypothetical protein
LYFANTSTIDGDLNIANVIEFAVLRNIYALATSLRVLRRHRATI